ncbi:hypothetical protein E4099_11245 [Streptomyces palmae]|uniref:Putative sensor domain-containing protein n=1 Tax=Streptomyces palmae TaxID=1701085 RepID=A0A4Z0HD30_9ACTN|nr:hypothetical protein E4099_11245 [Streptomyces palmae]
MTSPTAVAHASEPATGRPGRFWRELGYVLSGLPLGVAAFVVAVGGVAAGAASLAVLLGLPILVGALAAARGFARLERRRVEAVTGRAVPIPRYRRRGGPERPVRLAALRDPQCWRDLTHMLVSFPLRVVGFALALTWTVGGLGELLYGLWSWSIPRDDDTKGLLDLMFGISSRSADIAFHTAIGVVLLSTAIPMLRLLASAQTALARGLLAGRVPHRPVGW